MLRTNGPAAADRIAPDLARAPCVRSGRRLRHARAQHLARWRHHLHRRGHGPLSGHVPRRGRYHDKVLLSAAGIAQMPQAGPRQARGVFARGRVRHGLVHRPVGRGRRVVPLRRRAPRARRHDPGTPGGTGASSCCSTSACTAEPPGAAGDRAERDRHGGRRDGDRHRCRHLLPRVRRGRGGDPGAPGAGTGAARPAARQPGATAPGLLPRPGAGRRWALPLLWELGVPAAVAILPPAMFKVNWKGMFLYGPDLSCALTAIGGLAALTGLLRVVKARRSLPGQPPARRAAAHLTFRRPASRPEPPYHPTA